MSTTPRHDDRTDTTTEPETPQIAAELGVDATLLARFVDEHPRPTAPIVIGWATTRGELRAHPELLRDDVADWIEARERARDEADPVTDEELRETRLRAWSLRSILGDEY